MIGFFWCCRIFFLRNGQKAIFSVWVCGSPLTPPAFSRGPSVLLHTTTNSCPLASVNLEKRSWQSTSAKSPLLGTRSNQQDAEYLMSKSAQDESRAAHAKLTNSGGGTFWETVRGGSENVIIQRKTHLLSHSANDSTIVAACCQYVRCTLLHSERPIQI